MKKWTRWLLAGLVSSLLFGGARAARLAEGDLYIVVLEEPSLSEKVLEWTPGMSWRERHRFLSGDSAQRYRRGLEIRQSEWTAIAAARVGGGGLADRDGFAVTGRRTLLINALFVRTGSEGAERIAALPGVRGVFPNRRLELLTDAAPDFLGAPAVWDLLGGIEESGAGMRIGVIDSGIDVSHPMFQDEGLQTPAGFPLPAGASEHTNSKVIVARNYVLQEYGLRDEPAPMDVRGHGSTVAGIAAGSVLQAPLGTVRGMAPRAYLGNYRVFGSPSKNPFATDAAVIAALEDAIADGMDVVNMSLGGDPRDPASDPEQMTIANATRLGVVVVIAAGNLGGNGGGTVTSPGTSPDAITVGSTSHPRLFGNPIEVSSGQVVVSESLRRFVQVPGSGAPVTAPFGPLPLASIQPLDPGELACEGLPAGSLRGRVALVRRGTCFFSVKAANVLGVADAAAMVVYNNVAGAPFRMDFGELQPTRPAVMIDRARGLALRDLLVAGTPLEIVLGSQDEFSSSVFEGPLLVSDFSGRGPSIDLGVKPDLSAPGENLYTAAINPNGGEPLFSNPATVRGTSFATPLVAGAAALLRQLHPDWTVAQIKSALVNRADGAVSASGRPARVNETGAGRLDVARAASARLFAEPVSLGFGVFGEEGRTLTLTLSNRGNTAATLRFQAPANSPIAELNWDLDPLTVPPGESRQLQVSVRPGGVAGGLEGTFLVHDQTGALSLTIPYFGVAVLRDMGRTLLVSKSGGGQFDSVTAALAAALPGDIIEIDDNSTYRSPVRVSRNDNGIPPDGLTIRAGFGRQPVIDVAGLVSEGQAAVTLQGVKRVLVEGLTIRSSGSAVEFVEASGTLKNNTLLILDPEEAGDGVRAFDSRVQLFGNLITDAQRGISLVNSAGLIQNNRVLSSAGDGLVAVAGGTSALFGNRFEGTVGTGIRVTDSSLLAKSNQVLGGARSHSDGIRVEGPQAKIQMIDNLVAGTRLSGVALSGGGEARLLGDVVQSVTGAGLSLDAASAEAEAVRFLANGVGVRVFSGDLTLRNSLVAQSVSGPGIDFSDGRLAIDASTLADNAGFGLISGNPASADVLVSNTLFAGNLEGDLGPGGGGDFRFSLFEGTAPEGPGNRQGFPGFIAPAAGDYTPSGGDAIDAGDPAAATASTDLNFHRRVVDGDGDQRDRIDIGAIEAESFSAPSILLPIFSASASEFVGLALANAYQPAVQAAASAGLGSSHVLMRAFGEDGLPFGRAYAVDIPSGGQLALLLDQAVGALRNGWVEIQPDQRDLLAFSLVGGNGLRFLDGAPLNSRLSRRLLLPEPPMGADDAWIYLVNPHPQSQTLRLTWVREGASPVESEIQVSARGSALKSVRALLGPGEGGYLTIDAELSVQGAELFGNQVRRAGLSALDPEDAANKLFGAQLASTPQVETVIHIINLSGDGLVELTARDENGAEIASVSRALAAGGQLRADARELFGFRESEVVGWLEVNSTSPIAGTVVFGDPSGRFLASLPLQSVGAREFYLSHVAQTDELFTGLTLLNPGPDTALVSVEVFTAEGGPAGDAFLELVPGQKTARLLTEILGDDFRQAGGFVRVRSNAPMIGFELFGGYSLDFLSAVPAQVSVP